MSRALCVVVFVVGGLGLLGVLSIGMLPDHEVVYDAQAPTLVGTVGRLRNVEYLFVAGPAELVQRVRVDQTVNSTHSG